MVEVSRGRERGGLQVYRAMRERALAHQTRPGGESLPRKVIYNGADPARCYKRIGRQAQREK